MNAILKRFAGGILALAILLAVSQAQAVSLSLDPLGGALSGKPGDTVGWGFTLSNDSGFLVVSSAEFKPQPAIGSFNDFIGLQFLIVGPGVTVSQAFDTLLHTGIGSFVLDSNAPRGSVAGAPIALSYDLYSVNPLDSTFDPGVHTLSLGNIVTAEASVSVPEPGSLLLMASAMPVLVAWRRRAQRWDRAAANG